VTAQLSALLMIAQRDLIKFTRDRARLLIGFVLPFLFIGVFGGALQANLGGLTGYNLVPFAFTGVLGMTLFESAAMGIISLIEDRENDFSKEMFVAPISRFTIVSGKVLGETLVALTQGVGIVAFGLLIRVGLDPVHLLLLVPAALVSCLLGAGFGVATMAALPNRRAAQQIFPFVMMPQYFLAGVFVPIKVLPLILDVISRVSPMRYAVDLMRSAFYAGTPQYRRVVLEGAAIDLAVMVALFAVFISVGTVVFVRRERNR
jgi:ABC-2 type transport system permease protein